MKKFFLSLTATVVLSAFLLCGCSVGEAGRQQELQASMEATYEELTSTFSGSTGEFSLLSEYLSSWANKNGLQINQSHDNYTVIENPASSGYESAQSTVVQCAVKTNDFEESMQPLAITLTSLLGPEIHGSIRAIITENDSGNFSGANAVDEKYLECDNFINLSYSSSPEIYTRGAFTLSGTMSTSLESASPAYGNAFSISMTIPDYKDPFDFEKQYPNPAEVIGSLLATEKSSGQLFQIASFSCETSGGSTPHSATAVVVIDDNDVESFTNRFERSYNNMKERFSDLDDSFVYTMTETSMPSSVISNESSDNIISLMYTLDTGIYLQDEENGTIIAGSDISQISTSDGVFRAVITARSLEEPVLEEMSDIFLTTSGLCDISYTPSQITTTWSCDEEKDLGSFFVDALGQNSQASGTLLSSELNIFSSKADGLNAISYFCNMESGESTLTNMIHFLESLASG